MPNVSDADEQEPYGYLMVHFKENPAGEGEAIYFTISRGDTALRWEELNGGYPVLMSDQGTLGVRDPFIVRNPETGVYYILATDLRVYPTADGGEPDWAGMHINTSTRIDVWESHDLVHWSDMRQLDVSVGAEDKRFGIAWAPEAIWVDDYEGTGHGRFVFYWAATFGASGPDVTAYDRATMYPRMVWGTTTDFTQGTYEFGGVMLDTGAETIDTTIFREHRDDGTTRTYRLTKQNGRGAGNGIFEDYTDRPDWWKVPQDEWTYIDTHIGDGFAHELGNPDPGCAEGPETFPDNHSGRRYLFVDVLGVADTGYRPMYSDDTDDHVSYGDGQNAGWHKLDDPDYEMPPLVKHGGFINLTRAEYDELRRAY